MSRRFTRWYERLRFPPQKNHRRAAPWRYATPQLQAEFANFELSRRGAFYGITMHLGDEVEGVARKHGPEAKRYLTDRISYYLKAVLGRTSQFWFVLEESSISARHLHLHGAIACDDREVRKVRRALREAGGKWESRGAKYQVETKFNPDNGWVSYAFGDHFSLQVARFLPQEEDMAWLNDSLMITLDLKQGARVLYASMRKQVVLSKWGLRKLMSETPTD